ncbi:MAG: hypothetical protein VW600_06920 [Ferrovibrio sp.]
MRVAVIALGLVWFGIYTPVSKAADLCSIVSGSTLIAQDDRNTYLGKITNSFDSDSIFNEYGNYGNKFSANSIWNEYSTFGSEYNIASPFNKFSTSPPMIIKNRAVIGYLSSNKALPNSVTPNLLKALCADAF